MASTDNRRLVDATKDNLEESFRQPTAMIDEGDPEPFNYSESDDREDVDNKRKFFGPGSKESDKTEKLRDRTS